jgi:regulator of protease activity HflC (stomatin/prohibitin superfamily)
LLNARQQLTMEHFHLVQTGPREVALVYRNARLERVQAPAERTLVWKSGDRIEVEHIDVDAEPVAPIGLTPALGRLGVASRATFAAVPEGKCALLFVAGKFRESLTPGTYALWQATSNATVEIMDLRVQTLEINGQEILTADKVTLRVNVWAEYQIVDPVKARQSVAMPVEHLYRVVQMAVRQSLAKRTLDAVLEARTDLDEAVAGQVRAEASTFGFRVGAMAIKDIIPPGEVRAMLEEVVAAEKKAQANLIQRREETAATRSLLNTARLMAEHPLLVRMKELETLEKVSAKVEKIHLYGGFDAVLRGLVKLQAEDPS